jgi:hypothetical protein
MPTQQLTEPFFHRESGAVRFWVRTVEGDAVGAMVRKEAMHFRFRAAADGSDALSTYRNPCCGGLLRARSSR